MFRRCSDFLCVIRHSRTFYVRKFSSAHFKILWLERDTLCDKLQEVDKPRVFSGHRLKIVGNSVRPVSPTLQQHVGVKILIITSPEKAWLRICRKRSILFFMICGVCHRFGKRQDNKGSSIWAWRLCPQNFPSTARLRTWNSSPSQPKTQVACTTTMFPSKFLEVKVGERLLKPKKVASLLWCCHNSTTVQRWLRR